MGKHSVPQHYLRAFAAPGDHGMIWMFDQFSGQWKHLPIKAVAQGSDYFDSVTETALTNQIETPAQSALSKLREFLPITANDRYCFVNYIGAMMMRVPRRRRKALELAPGVIAETIRQFRDEVAELTQKGIIDETTAEKALEEADKISQEHNSAIPESMLNVINSPFPRVRILAAINEMTWRVVSATTTPVRLLTSDNPVYFHEGIGLGHADAEFTLPLSPDVVLMADRSGPPRGLLYMRGNTALMKEVNRRAVAGAERFVFHHERADWVTKVFANTQARPRPNRIKWDSRR
jgi:hypothetical protein